MSQLFSRFQMRGLTLRNRIMVSPMCQYSAVQGEASDWHRVHVGSLALSGAGLFCFEATAVEPEGRITPGCLGLWDERTEAALQAVIAIVRKYSPIALAVQLAHAGRKGSSHLPWEGGQLIPVSEGGWLPYAPSALAHKEGEDLPQALDDAGLERVRGAFVAAAKRAMRLGLDAIELHSAHGYLLHEFLSPIANHREDRYGGSLDNRMRFPLEVFEAVRAAVPPDKPVGVKVSATDWVEGGWDLEQTIVYSRELQRRGVDWVDVSSGGISPAQQIPVKPSYQVPFARQAEEIIARGDANLVAIARGMLYDPRWPWHAAAELGASVEVPPQYWRSQPSEQKQLFDNAARTGGR
jgi:2,4-dienoyl-CoA reductase-like NADH-dependent reductase (Old Yellow Enzyme family)